jgi:hypothetical protein
MLQAFRMRLSIGASALAVVLGHAAGTACSRREPPTPDGSPSVAYPEPAPAPLRSASSSPSASAAPPETASAAPPAPLPSASSDALLPQTRDKPRGAGPAFDARVRSLWEAIVMDNPEWGMPMFFPLGAYQQVKDVPNPAADWRQRLVAAYARDIHALHAALGANAARAKLVALDVPDARARWVDPGEEYNKMGYYRVFGSRLRYGIDGAAHDFDVKSLISWRGEWYVVHLSAIK